MKKHLHNKTETTHAQPGGQRSGGIRPHAAKALEHRYERRKIREQLRHLDWVLAEAD